MSTQTQSQPLCDICRRSYKLEEANLSLDLCSEHIEAVSMQIAERVLRDVIPPDFHSAHPRDLPDGLKQLSFYVGDMAGVYLFGNIGAGKSYAAAALLKRAYMQNVKSRIFPDCCWVNVPTLILDTVSAIQSRRNPSTAWDSAKNAGILVLDDIGFENPKDWIRTRLYAVIEHRLQHRLVTIVTSNLALDELADRLDAPQIASRLSAMCHQYNFTGEDRRPKKLGQ